MFCPTCGFDCKDENFCPKCGSNLKIIDLGKKDESPTTNPDTVQPGSTAPTAPKHPDTNPQPIPSSGHSESLARKAYAAEANLQLFLFASIFFTIGALIDALVQFEGGSYSQLGDLFSYVLPDLKGLSTYGVIAALAMLVIAFALWGLRFQSTAKKTVEPVWFYIIFGALLAHLLFNAVVNIKLFSAIIKLREWMGSGDEANVMLVYAIALLVGCIFGAVLEGIAARIVLTAAQGKSIMMAGEVRFMRVILQIVGWIGAISGVVGLFLIKDSFFTLVSVIASSIARILFGRVLSDYTY